MTIKTFVLDDLLEARPELRSQIYFKSSLTALSHAMEDQVLAGLGKFLVIATFQRERFYRQEASRYLRIADLTDQVYVMAAPETNFSNRFDRYEMVAFDMDQPLSQEWNLVVLSEGYASCLICREQGSDHDRKSSGSGVDLPQMDQTRRFEGIWTFDRGVTCTAARLLLDRILAYRPNLAHKVDQAKAEFLHHQDAPSAGIDPAPFADRLVTYLQAGQYKLQKAYRAIAIRERKERLANSITEAIRRSLNPDEILRVAVQELGQALKVCRCLIYRCKESDSTVTLRHEYRHPCKQPGQRNRMVKSLIDQTWPLQNNPLFQAVVAQKSHAYVDDVFNDPRFANGNLGRSRSSKDPIQKAQIRSWMMVPVLYQQRLLGMVELHYCGAEPHQWSDTELSLVDTIASQVGVALIQAEAYAHLDELNQQLEALDRTRSNLVAITGHELRTPLSTIQVCLESLASEPDMPRELQQVMLETALIDADRMRKLVQDFLTLSRLESGRIEWRLEPLPIQECFDLALSSIRTRHAASLPKIQTKIPKSLPLIRADGEWLVEVLTKLLENACKFTQADGQVMIQAKSNGNRMVEVTIRDTGRGIEPDRLEVVFDRFYQEEGALRRSAGGTGLGLAICRQIISALGGQIWAQSEGRDQGSEFHFTIPVFRDD